MINKHKKTSIKRLFRESLAQGVRDVYSCSCLVYGHILTHLYIYPSTSLIYTVFVKLVNKSQHENKNFVPANTDSCFGSERITSKNISCISAKPDKQRASGEKNVRQDRGFLFLKESQNQRRLT